MKNRHIKNLILFSFILLVCNGLIGFSVYKGFQKLNDSEQWIKHTDDVISNTKHILILSKDLEIASRDFVITNSSEYTEPFKFTDSILENMVQLKYLTKDNQSQQKRIDSLNLNMHLYLGYLSQSIEIRSKEGLTSAITYILAQRGKRYSDHVRQNTDAILQEENTLLKQREQKNERSALIFNLVIIIMISLMVVFTIFLILISGRYLIQLKDKEKQANRLIIAIEEKEEQLVANKELEAFSYSVSHDLRAPLRHISGFIDLLIKNNSSQLNETGLRYLNIISESSHEMGCLIDALLTFSRLNRTELQRIKINTKKMVTRIIESFRDEISSRNVEINVSELPDAMGDESLINQVWINLISNALKYTRNKDKAIIDIGSKMDNDKIIFYIKDNGVGFDMKYANKLFGVFQRLHKARDFEGIGIGLANVNRIITRHGGTCWAESEVDKGATFFFSKPNNYLKNEPLANGKML